MFQLVTRTLRKPLNSVLAFVEGRRIKPPVLWWSPDGGAVSWNKVWINTKELPEGTIKCCIATLYHKSVCLIYYFELIRKKRQWNRQIRQIYLRQNILYSQMNCVLVGWENSDYKLKHCLKTNVLICWVILSYFTKRTEWKYQLSSQGQPRFV